MDKVVAADHPDCAGGIVWSKCELEWINTKLEQKAKNQGMSDLADLMQKSLEEDTSRIGELLDQVEQQAARIKELESLVSAQGIAAMDDADGLAQQEARIKELEADAARFRWLVAKCEFADIGGRWNMCYENWDGCDGSDGLTVAIDAAMKGCPK